MACTWDPANTSSSILLDGGNMIATVIGGEGGDRLTRSTVGYSSGLRYFEADIGLDALGGSTSGVGLATAAMGPDDFLGTGVAIFDGGSSYYINGANTGSGLAFATGARVRGAVNFDTKFVWLAVDAGNWNGNASFDPSTGVGGKSIAALSGTIYAAVEQSHVGDFISGKFTLAFFKYPIPSGYSQWDPDTSVLVPMLSM